MLNPRIILVPTDFSTCADAALTLGIEFARRFNATLRIVHITEPGGRAHSWGRHPLCAEWGRHSNGSQHARLEWEGVTVDADVLPGKSNDATDALLDEIAKSGIDLVVMGSHGRESVRRFLNDAPDQWSIGRTARSLVPEAHCPVLTVGPRGSLISGPFEHVILPVDLTTHSGVVLAFGRSVAQKYDARIDVVHVVDASVPSRRRAELRRQLRALADEWIVDRTVRVRILEGTPAEAIIRHAASYQGSIIVTATHGMKRRADTAVGSVADALVRSAPVPVLSIRPHGKLQKPTAEGSVSRPIPQIPS